MPFGLTNAPATFQDMINHIFRDMLDLGLLAYIDDLLIYAEKVEEYDKIVKEVLQRLRTNRLAISAEKCSWRQPEVEFLGYVIGRDGIKMSDAGSSESSAGPTPTAEIPSTIPIRWQRFSIRTLLFSTILSTAAVMCQPLPHPAHLATTDVWPIGSPP